jgi:hypothetical protein
MSKGRERSVKWYFRNEKEVMKELGFTPTAGSGNSWLDKEDGHNDYILAQLKSTDKESYKLKELDLLKLEYNANVSKKIPMFILQFLKNDSRYALVKIEDIPKVAEYIKTGHTEINKLDLGIIEGDDEEQPKIKNKIKSSSKAREKFYKQKEKEREARKWK